MIDLLDKLNESQKEAVLHTEGPLLILAGAGSGKTRVITHRTAHLILNKGVAPYNIFSVTFTNKAAGEMKHRVSSLIGPQGNSVFIKTFHSAAVYILRRFGESVKVDRNFSIYDTGDQATLIKEIMNEMKLDVKRTKPSSIASRISEIKDKPAFVDGAPLDELLSLSPYKNFTGIFYEYQERMQKLNALDFNDLLVKTVNLLREEDGTLENMQRFWRYFMVDEYQDTNYSQYLIAKYLSSADKNICVVGDDDQSIYSWRGADIRNILEFEKDFSNAKTITLNKNYRSTSQILDAAYAVIQNNNNRKDKKVSAVRNEGELIECYKAENEYGEAQFVVDKIVSLKHREGLTSDSFAIFYRTNAQSRVFEEFLRREGLPYRIIGGLKFYDRKEIKDIVAYLRFIVNSDDLVSLLRIINTPARGVGIATISRVRETAAALQVSEWTVLREGLLAGKTHKGLEEFRELVSGAMSIAASVPESMTLSDLVKAVIESSGYKAGLEADNSIESTQRLENINEFLNSVYEYEQVNPDATLYQFLQEISLLTSEEDPAQAGPIEAVTLMTVHNAKGLEFPVVFLTGMEEDTFPHRFSVDTEEGVEEERRLCYVGITRAKERLYISCAELRRSFADVLMKQPSRFIFEIPEQYINFESYDFSGQERFSPPGRSYGNYQSTSFADSTATSSSVFTKNQMDGGKVSSEYSRFDMVVHPKYGSGKIISVEGSGDNLKLTIHFSSGVKTFLEKYTPLEKLH